MRWRVLVLLLVLVAPVTPVADARSLKRKGKGGKKIGKKSGRSHRKRGHKGHKCPKCRCPAPAPRPTPRPPLGEAPFTCGAAGSTPLEPFAPSNTSLLNTVGPCKLPVGDPVVDPEGLLLRLETTWVQLTPWLAKGNITFSHPWTDGWAMLPDDNDGLGYGCLPGGYCPYVCKPPYVEGGFDNQWGLGGYFWQQINQQGQKVYYGAGRRFPTPFGQCMGGQQGLYCAEDGSLVKSAPSFSGNISSPGVCIVDSVRVTIENQTPFRITSCRKVFPPDYIGIPLAMEPRSAAVQWPTINQGRVVPGTDGKKRFAWAYTGGFGDRRGALGLKQYLSIPEVPGQPVCLQPWCQKVNVRPEEQASGFSPIGNNAYNPYEVRVASPLRTEFGFIDLKTYTPCDLDQLDVAGPIVDPNIEVPENGDFTVTLRMNTLASVGFPVEGKIFSNYDTSLGNPRYGVQIYDQTGKLACYGYWSGGPNVTCNSYCRQKNCANTPYCTPGCQSGAANSVSCCANVALDAPGVQPPSYYLTPSLLNYGAALPPDQSCNVLYDPKKTGVVRVVLVENQP